MQAARIRRPRKPGADWRSQTVPLSTAKTYLGRLMEKAARGETEFIAKGRRRFALQHVPEIDPIPLRPAGYFAHCYTAQEIQEENRLAKSSVIRPPKDLE